MTSLEDRLARFEAESEINRTFFRFFELVDARRYTDIGPECLAPDADLEYHVPAPHRLLGRDEFTRYMVSKVAPRSQRVAHVLGHTVVEWNGSTPRVKSRATVWHWYQQFAEKGDLRPADWTTVGQVEDEFARVEGRWLIARRVVTPIAGVVAAGASPPSLPDA
ncbi:nuclear transport factor 2 family protein [Nocardia higoensis]|uniref:nuclear transport factor 2 family protein n=1 Tax=Nocardia higoensis TaxID=228599 RepID=UPI0002EE79C2|nr:nuclear transport factor 2 family protein [Nocardia higoensis]